MQNSGLTVDSGKVGVKPPPVPDKHDIVPIHTSDRALFKLCRRKWGWNSPTRLNLVPNVEMQGVYMPLWFGTGVHHSLESMYDPALRRDPVESFKTWFSVVWEGGTVTAEQLKYSYDRKPVIVGYEHVSPSGNPKMLAFDKAKWNHNQAEVITEGTPALFEVRGLRDLAPDPDPEEFEQHYELGVGMLGYYRDVYAPRYDDFAVIMVEHDFSIPLGFNAVDPRDGEIKPVHYRGRMDAIIQDLETGRYGILDHKTDARYDEEARQGRLDKDEQCTSYLWAAEIEAAIHDLEYREVDYVVYNVMRKAYPKPPTFTTKGTPSLNKSEESTTAAMFREAVNKAGLSVWLAETEKAQSYLAYLEDLGEKSFVQRDYVRRNRAEIDSCEWRVVAEAKEMLNPDLVLYPNPRGTWDCTRCIFRAACIAADDGSDWKMILNENFVRNSDR